MSSPRPRKLAKTQPSRRGGRDGRGGGGSGGSGGGRREATPAVASLLMRDYFSIDVRVDVDTIDKVAHTVRPVDESNTTVESFRYLFLTGLYGTTGEKISVCFQGLPPSVSEALVNALKAKPLEERVLSSIEGLDGVDANVIREKRLTLVDGAHRLVALCDPSVKLVANPVAARLFFRIDKKPFQNFDVLTVGALLNQGSSEAIKMTAAHRIHLVWSFLQTISKESVEHQGSTVDEKELIAGIKKDGRTVDTVNIMALCRSRQYFHGIGNAQATKYCNVATGLFKLGNRGMEGFDVVKKFSNLNQYCSRRVWKAKTMEEQLFVLEMLQALEERWKEGRLETAAASGNKPSGTRRQRDVQQAAVASSEEARAGEIATRIMDLWNQIMAVFANHGITDEAVALKHKVQKNPTKSAVTSLRKAMRTWLLVIPEKVFTASDANDWHERVSAARQFVESTTKWPELSAPAAPSAPTPTAPSAPEAPSTPAPTVPSAPGTGTLPPEGPSVLTQPRNVEEEPTDDENDDVQVEDDDVDDVQVEYDDVDDEDKSDSDKDSDNDSDRNEGRAGDVLLEEELATSPLTMKKARRPQKGKKRLAKSSQRKKKKTLAKSSLLASPSRGDGGDGGGRRDAPVVDNSGSATSMRSPRATASGSDTPAPVATAQAPWEAQVNVVREPADSNGFQVTHRWPTGFAFKYPKPRTSGVQELSKEKGKDVPEGALPWYKGTITRKNREPITVHLMEDFVGTVSTLNPTWRLDPEPTEEDVDEHQFVSTAPNYGDRARLGRMRAQKILRLLGFRPPHPSHFLLTVRELTVLRRFVHAGMMKRMSVLGQMLAESGIAGESAAEAMEEATKEVCRLHRAKLDSSGFVVFEGLLKDVESCESWYLGEDGGLEGDNGEEGGGDEDLMTMSSVGERMLRFFEHMESFLPTEDELDSGTLPEAKSRKWRTIRDTTELPDDSGPNAKSRFTTAKHAVNDDLVTLGIAAGDNKFDILRGRVYMEVMIMLLCAFLRLRFSTFDRKDSDDAQAPLIHAPDTGGRGIASAPLLGPQTGHTDHFHDYKTIGKDEEGRDRVTVKYPAYFAMVTSANTTPLWVCEGSQKCAFLSMEELASMREHECLRTIYIPPYSVIVMRGDVIHAGAGAMEAMGNWCTRYHMYILRDGVALADGINDQGFGLELLWDDPDIEKIAV